MKILYCISFALAIFTMEISAQDVKGLWISTYQREVQTVNERVDIQENELVTVKLDSTEVNYFYKESYILLDFIDDKNVIVKGIFGITEKSKYKIRNGSLKIKSQNILLKGQISDSCIVLKDQLSNTEVCETFLVRMNNIFTDNPNKLDSISFMNTNFSNTEFDFLLLDSSVAVITNCYGDSGYVHLGYWQTDKYQNQLFLGITDYITVEKNVYHLRSKEGDSLIGNTYNSFNLQPSQQPILEEIELIEEDLSGDLDKLIRVLELNNISFSKAYILELEKLYKE